jgi:hypothetical protein
MPEPLPGYSPAASPFEIVSNRTPIRLTVTEDWQKVSMTVSAEDVMSSAPLWRKMHLDDWDRVPMPYRRAALDAMRRRYGWVTQGPEVWEGMDAIDWDVVPQPIRAVAFIRMAQERARGIGDGSSARRQLVADTLGAIIATESWFEHRAVNVNPAGDRDLGIGQLSAFCRHVLRRRSMAGAADCPYRDEEYANPWMASHAAAVWFGLMLDEADGDVDLAVRAYHRGIGHARLGAATAYLDRVKRHRRWVDGSYAGSPSWRHLTARVAAPRGAAGAGPTCPSRRRAGDSAVTAPPNRSR